MTKVRPLHDRILVKRIDEEAKTKEKPMQGKLLAVGKGRVDEDGVLHPLDVQKGDRVLFGKYSGSEIQVAGPTASTARVGTVRGPWP